MRPEKRRGKTGDEEDGRGDEEGMKE